jgi:hypothetical protein
MSSAVAAVAGFATGRHRVGELQGVAQPASTGLRDAPLDRLAVDGDERAPTPAAHLHRDAFPRTVRRSWTCHLAGSVRQAHICMGGPVTGYRVRMASTHTKKSTAQRKPATKQATSRTTTTKSTTKSTAPDNDTDTMTEAEAESLQNAAVNAGPPVDEAAIEANYPPPVEPAASERGTTSPEH